MKYDLKIGKFYAKLSNIWFLLKVSKIIFLKYLLTI